MRKLLTVFGLAMLLASCGQPEVPTSPPQLTTPPAVATSGFLTAYVEDTIPMDRATLRRFMEEQPIVDFLEPTESISNPVEFEVLEGTWPEPGATRRVRLADGHYVIERVLENDPGYFSYQIFVFTNATGRGVDQIVGEQRFVPVDGGTRFEWTYKVRPKNVLARQVVRANMAEIESYISGGLQGFAAAARTAAGQP